MNNIAAVESIEVLLQAPLRIKAGSEPHQPELIKIPLSIGAPPAVVTPSLASDDRMNLCGNDAKVGRWTETEHAVFLEGLSMHGKQWKTIATMIGTRSVVQVRTHAQKYFQKLDRKIKPNTPAPKRKGTPTDVLSGACEQVKKPKRVSARLSLSGPKKPSVKRNALPLPVTTQSLAPQVPSSNATSQQAARASPSDMSETLSDYTETVASPHTVTEYLDEHAAALGLLDDEPLEWLLDSELAGLDVLSDEAFIHTIDDDALQPILP